MAKTNLGVVLAVLIAGIVLGILGLPYLGISGAAAPVVPILGQAAQPAESISVRCPNDGDSSLTFNLYNLRNRTASETFDVTAYLYGNQGDFRTITDTTAGTATLNCDEEYTMKAVRSDSNGGDNSRILEVAPGSAATTRIVDGNAVFTPTRSNVAVNLKGSVHGVLEFRAFDIDNNGFMCNSDDTCTDWELDGVTFESTTNGTALAVGAGGEINVRVYYRSTRTDTDFNDFGYYILIDTATTVWDTPSCSVNGVAVSDIKGTFTVPEARQFAGYEYGFRIDAPVTDTQNTLTCRFKALAGVNPGASDDPQIDFASIGQYLSIDGTTVKKGAAVDDASSTVTFTIQDTTIDVS